MEQRTGQGCPTNREAGASADPPPQSSTPTTKPTRGWKASELRPCAICGQPLRKPPLIQWYVVRVATVILKPEALNQVMGMTQAMGGSLALAETFVPQPNVADEVPGAVELHVCYSCVHGDPHLGVDLLQINGQAPRLGELGTKLGGE